MATSPAATRSQRGTRCWNDPASTVNKERARHGESKTSSRTSTQDVSSGHRGGKRSHTGAAGRTKDQLYAEAKRRNVKGRSSMTKTQLEHALAGK